jgi:YidC/Oxa1 family membrane protein insertase
MMDYLSNIMLSILDIFYGAVPNYGVAIILFTIAIKAVLHPLTAQSFKQMSAMQKLQPKVKELQKQYQDNPKELQQRTMELYQTEKVNPLGGCLPTLLQLPIFIAMFFAIQKLPLGTAGSSFLWIADLSKPDPTNILIVLIGLSTFWAQKTMPQTTEGAASAMMMLMPLFIAFVSMPFAAGLQIFWVAQTAVTGLQQIIIMKMIKQEGSR